MWSTSSSGPRVDFAICGGIAVTIHGAPRFTRDIDLLIRAEDESRAVGAVALAGFDLPADPMVFDACGPLERRILRVSKSEGSDLLTLDLIVASPSFEDVWSTRVLVEWEGRRVPVVSVAARDLEALPGRRAARTPPSAGRRFPRPSRRSAGGNRIDGRRPAAIRGAPGRR